MLAHSKGLACNHQKAGDAPRQLFRRTYLQGIVDGIGWETGRLPRAFRQVQQREEIAGKSFFWRRLPLADLFRVFRCFAGFCCQLRPWCHLKVSLVRLPAAQIPLFNRSGGIMWSSRCPLDLFYRMTGFCSLLRASFAICRGTFPFTLRICSK